MKVNIMTKIKDYKYYDKIITKIEKTRSKNNINWMDLLRIGFKFAPKETIKLMKKINFEDKKISNLLNLLIKK